MIPVEFQKFNSYSCYAGSYKDEYKLTDQFFCRIVDGCLICSDTQETIDIMGNVCLVHPTLGVLHLGSIPRPEYDGEIRFSFDTNGNLTISVKCYAANGRKHGYWEETVIDTHYNSSMADQLLKKKLLLQISSKVKARQGGSIRTNFRCYSSSETTIRLVVDYKKFGYGYRVVKEDYFTQDIILTDKGFLLLPDANKGEDSVLPFITERALPRLLYDFNLEHGYIDKTPFIVNGKALDGKYAIKDLEDGVVEYYSKEEIYDILSKGITIRGVDVLPNKCIAFRLS